MADTINSETTKKPKDFFKTKILESIYLDPPSSNEVTNQITSLKNKAVGHDSIQPFFLKAARHVVAPYLSLFLSFVFTKGIFPRNCKIARITSIYKSGAKEEMNSYHIHFNVLFKNHRKDPICGTWQFFQKTQCNIQKSTWFSKQHFHITCDVGRCHQ